MAVLLGTAVRAMPLPELLDEPLQLASGDSFYHVRRMALAAELGWDLPARDAWVHHPDGNRLVWPPGFDVAGGLLARVLGGGPQDLEATALGGIWLVVLLGAATFALVYAAAARRGGPVAGVFAVLVLAFLPGHHNYTHAGKIDHHAAEALLTFLGLHLLLRAATPGSLRARALRTLAAAAVLGAMPLTWPSSAVSILLLAGCAGLRLLLATRAERGAVAATLATAFALAGVATLPFGLGSAFGVAGETVAHALSPLQPGLLLTTAAVLAAMAAAGMRAGRAAPVWMVAAGGVAVAVGLAGWPAGRQALLGGTEFVGGRGYVGLIQESAPLWERGLARALGFVGAFVLVVPALVGWAAAGAVRLSDTRAAAGSSAGGSGRAGGADTAAPAAGAGAPATGVRLSDTATVTSGSAAAPAGPRVKEPLLLPTAPVADAAAADRATWAAALFVGTLLAGTQARFVVLLAVPVAVLSGEATANLLGRLQARRTLRVAVLLGFVGLLVPGLVRVAAHRPALARRVPVWHALQWLSAHAPPAGDPWHPLARPAYSVLAPWGFGHELLVLGGFANVASPLIAPGETRGLDAALQFALTDDPGVAESILERHTARYVLTSALSLSAMGAYAEAMGLSARDFVRPAGGDRLQPTTRALRATAFALHEGLGSALPADESGQAPGRAFGFLRLIHAADGGRAKVFERVAGARLRGHGFAPRSPIHARVMLDVAGEGFVWLAPGRTDAAGRFEIRIPYATSGPPTAIRVLGATLVSPDGETPVQVSESAVRTGGAVDVQAPAPGR